MKFSLTKEAETDIKEIVGYLAQESPQAARNFLKEFTKACTHLAEMPQMAQKAPEEITETIPILSDCRRWPLRRFSSHLVFYKPEREGILVLRVVNGKRDLPVLFGSWEY